MKELSFPVSKMLFFYFSPFLTFSVPLALMDQRLTLQDLEQVQSVKAVCVHQYEFAPTTAGLRDTPHLWAWRVEAHLKADFYSWQL